MKVNWNRRRRRAARRRAARVAGASLRALGTGALALYGMADDAAADAPSEHYRADYDYSMYSEDDLQDSRGLAGGETSRYDIKTHQFLLQAPLLGRYDLELELTHETMSGASPIYVVPDAAGDPIQVMSGATISEERNDILVKANRYYENARMGFGGGYSTENDYDAINFSFDGETHFNEKNTTLAGGLGVSLDSIEPTDADLVSTRPDSEDKKSFSLFLGLSQLLERRAVLQSSFSLAYASGYLSDPYKQVFVVGGVFLPDERPDDRLQFAWLTRVRKHIEEVNGTVHAGYQFYIDDWGIASHTLDFAWHQTLWDHLRVAPSVRYYTQSESDFYVTHFDVNPGPGEYSSDYRVSAFGSVILGLNAEYSFRTRWTGRTEWLLRAGAERYFSGGALSHETPSTEAPGLVNFTIFTLGLGVKY
jgi:hypothetical protein